MFMTMRVVKTVKQPLVVQQAHVTAVAMYNRRQYSSPFIPGPVYVDCSATGTCGSTHSTTSYGSGGTYSQGYSAPVVSAPVVSAPAVTASAAIQVAAAPAVQYHVQQVLHSNLTGLAYNLLAQQDLVQHPATGLPARPAMVRHQRLPALTAQAKPQIAQLVQLNRLTAHVCKAEAPRLMPAHRRQSSRVMPARIQTRPVRRGGFFHAFVLI